MKIWVKLIRAIAGSTFAVGEIVEIDEPVARAYIAAGYVEEAAAPAAAAIDAATAAEIANVRAAFTETLTLINAQVRASNEALRPLVQVQGTESEDEKLVPTGGFRSLGHFSLALVRGYQPGSPDGTFREPLEKYLAAATRVNRSFEVGSARAASGMYEASDPDGGALIPPQFSGILRGIRRTAEFIPR